MKFTMHKSFENQENFLYGSGKITVIMLVNLGRFVAEEDTKSRLLFRIIRGSYPYIQCIRKLKIPNLFTRLDQNVLGGDPWIENQGFEIGVFQKHLVENWFFPTYELDKSAALDKISPELSQSPLFQEEWKRWDRYKIRLTRNGFIQVKLTRKFQREKLYDLSIQLLESERDEFRLKLLEVADDLPPHRRDEIKRILRHTLQWQLAYQVIELFINQISEMTFGRHGVVRFKMPEEERKTPIRDKYTVIFFRELFNKDNANEVRLTASEIFADNKYAGAVQTILDGNLISDKETETIQFPSYWDKEINRLQQDNLSTFKDEICLFRSERALIYCPLSEQSIHLPFKGGKTKEGVRYNDYWKCIIRGVEHILALRTELQMVEAYTSEEMNLISEFTHELTTRGISRQEQKDVEKLSKRVANLFKILVSIRDVLVAPSTYRASYAIDKFEKLTHILGIYQIETHVERNIEELNFFITYFNNLAIQQNGERLQRLAFGFGMVIGFLGLASLLKDAVELHTILNPTTVLEAIRNFCVLFSHLSTFTVLILIWLIVSLVFIAGWKAYTYFK